MRPQHIATNEEPLTNEELLRERLAKEHSTKKDLLARVYTLECQVEELMAAVRLLANITPEPQYEYAHTIELRSLRVHGFPLKVNLPTGHR